MARAGRGLVVGLLAIGLVACAAPAPSPTAVPSVQPARSPSPEPDVEPLIVCEAESGQRPPTTLTCDAAVAVAIAALPANHLPIIRVEFYYGAYCPPGARCLAVSDQNGYVVFKTKGRGPDLWVSVWADERGKVSLTSEVGPFPPIVG